MIVCEFLSRFFAEYRNYRSELEIQKNAIFFLAESVCVHCVNIQIFFALEWHPIFFAFSVEKKWSIMLQFCRLRCLHQRSIYSEVPAAVFSQHNTRSHCFLLGYVKMNELREDKEGKKNLDPRGSSTRQSQEAF